MVGEGDGVLFSSELVDGQVSAGEERDRERAFGIAYAYINRRERTVAEVDAQLERKGAPSGAREAVLAMLAAQRFLDDERFARLFVDDKRRLEQWGSDRIRRGLIARGIPRAMADAALQTPPTDDAWATDGAPESELERAVALLRRRYPTAPQDRRERERALGLLLRKGYESELALDALAAYARDD